MTTEKQQDIRVAVDGLIAALNFYSDPQNYVTEEVAQDNGVKARKSIQDFHFALTGEKLKWEMGVIA